MKIPITSITIPNRQRTDLGDLETLAASLRDNGQITPILVAAEAAGTYRLIAGCRRTHAAKSNNWTHIEAVDRVTIDDKVILAQDLTPLQLEILEYEENVRRKDMTWQESCLSVARLHFLKQMEHGFASVGTDTGAWTERKMADFTGFGRSQVHYMLAIAKELQVEPRSAIWECENYSSAFQFLVKRSEAEVQAEIERRRQRANPPRVIATESSDEEDDDGGFSPSAASIPSNTEEAVSEAVVVYLHGVRKAFPDCIPDEDFMAGMAFCIVGFGVPITAYPNVKAYLRPEGAAVLWNGIPPVPGLQTMPSCLIWNKVKVGAEKHTWPYADNYVFGYVVTPATTLPKEPPITATISCVPDGDTLPPAVVEHSVTPFTLDGMAVYCLDGVNPVHVAELGRIPIWFEADETKFAAKCAALKTFYEATIPGVIVKVRA